MITQEEIKDLVHQCDVWQDEFFDQWRDHKGNACLAQHLHDRRTKEGTHGLLVRVDIFLELSSLVGDLFNTPKEEIKKRLLALLR